MKQESLENKLYSVRGVEKKPNLQETGEMRLIESELRSIPEFVAVVPQGSLVKGYSAESSDMDLAILYDSSGVSYNTKEYWEQRNTLSEAMKKLKLDLWEKRKRDKQNLRNVSFRLYDVNQDVLENKFLPEKRFIELAYLFCLLIGEKGKMYRKNWTEKINNLSPQEKSAVVENIVEVLSKRDFDFDTLKERVAIEDKEKLFESRRNLWKKRIEKLLEISD